MKYKNDIFFKTMLALAIFCICNSALLVHAMLRKNIYRSATSKKPDLIPVECADGKIFIKKDIIYLSESLTTETAKEMRKDKSIDLSEYPKDFVETVFQLINPR